MSALAYTLSDVAVFLRRFVVLNERQLVALALWVAHTHAVDAADTTPYISVTSAEKRCGKTRLLEVLELLVHEPLPAVSISDAALFRAIGELNPSILFDEVDAIFGPKAREREDLRSMLNVGYRRGATALRMGGQNMRALERFPVFCPKVFAGIGELPDTIADRAIRIRLERRTADEAVERFRRRDVGDEGHALHDRVADLLVPQLQHIASLRPQLPSLDDRAQDLWEPLLALAELAGADWPEMARDAALVLSSGDERQDDSLTVQLLTDIRTVFESNGTDRYRTSDLIEELGKIEESPWGDWYGKPISAQRLSTLLKPYRIRTMPVWGDDGKTVRGYKSEQFDEAFLRVLGVRSVRSVRSGSSSHAGPNAPNAPNGQATGNSRFCDDCVTPGRCDATGSCAEIERLAALAAETTTGEER